MACTTFILTLASGVGGMSTALAMPIATPPPIVARVAIVAQVAMDLRPGERISFFGDSITDQGGFIEDIRQSQADALGDALTLINRGLNGGMVGTVLEGASIYGDFQPPFQECLRLDRPTVVVIFLGVNDARFGPSLAQYGEGLRTMVRLGQRAGARVVLATPAIDGELPIGENPNDVALDENAAMARLVAEEEGAFLVDLRDAFARKLAVKRPSSEPQKRSGALTTDGIHLNSQGDRLVASYLLNGIQLSLEPALIPFPGQVQWQGNWIPIPEIVCIESVGGNGVAEAMIARGLKALSGNAVTLVEPSDLPSGGFRIRLKPSTVPPNIPWCVYRLIGETIHFDEEGCTIQAHSQGYPVHAAQLFLQAISKTDAGLFLPYGRIHNSQAFAYRSLMIDVARQWHPTADLLPLIDLASFYGLRQVQLHLTDDQSFTFPSTAFPDLATPGRQYSLTELEMLVDYASARGVILVPELDLPGHSSEMRRRRPDLFDSIDPETRLARDLGVINIGKEATWEAIDVLIGEIAQVFHTSPWIHVGGDEAWLGRIRMAPETGPALQELGSSDTHDLFLLSLSRLHQIVKAHGKQTMMWESFRGTGSEFVTIPTEVMVFGWETMYELPQNLQKNGYPLINASWKPLYITPGRRFSRKEIYGWNPRRFENWWEAAPSFTPIELENHDGIQGAMMCSWEMAAKDQLDALRPRVAMFSDRLRFRPNDHALSRILRWTAATDRRFLELYAPVEFDFVSDGSAPAAADEDRGSEWFATRGTLYLHALAPGRQLRYTTDGSRPDEGSPLYQGPLEIDRTTEVRVRVSGNPPVERRRSFRLDPVDVEIRGLLTHLPNERPWLPFLKFGPELQLDFRSRQESGTIRYTLDGSDPTVNSPAAGRSLWIDQSTIVSARCFDGDQQPLGQLWRRSFERVDFERNLTTGKPTAASSQATAKHSPGNAADGVVDLATYWDGSDGGAEWWSVDLQELHPLSKVQLWTYWDGGRFYQYTVETSADGEHWQEVVDARNNTTPASAKGYTHSFPPTTARHVRINLLHNSANPGKHLVEVRVYQ